MIYDIGIILIILNIILAIIICILKEICYHKEFENKDKILQIKRRTPRAVLLSVIFPNDFQLDYTADAFTGYCDFIDVCLTLEETAPSGTIINNYVENNIYKVVVESDRYRHLELVKN